MREAPVWPGRDSAFVLEQGEAHVWCIFLDDAPQEEALAVLTQHERERARRFHGPLLQHRYIAAHSALRSLLSLYLGLPPSAFEFVEGPHGKPALSIPSAIRFNLSHSGAIALVALSASCEIGVDVEEVLPVGDAQGLATRFFSPAEAKALAVLERPGQRSQAFLEMWVQKEAVLKALGVGLSRPLSDIAVSFGRPEHACVDVVQESRAPEPWHVWDVSLGDAYVAALAASDRLSRIERHHWNWGVLSR